MTSIGVGIPFVRPVDEPGKLHRTFDVRDGVGDNVSLVLGEIIRDFLVSTNDERERLYASVPTEHLPEIDELLRDVPDEIWRQHGFFPRAEWEAPS